MGHNALKIMLNGYVDKVFKHKVSLKVHNKMAGTRKRADPYFPPLKLRVPINRHQCHITLKPLDHSAN